MSNSCRVIAYYLPQYHPIPENDAWWGKGFTEWVNTAKAKPLFPGHYQPHVPADLGFYDLRVPEVRIAQADMAREYGIEGFCYYHYWFAGKKLLERPFNEVLQSGHPNFPFCLCWANESWTGVWHGAPGRILIKQTYPGIEDDNRHFFELMKAFEDERYIRVDNKPILLIYRPQELPSPRRLTDYWRTLAIKNGLGGLYIVGVANEPWAPHENGFDAATNTLNFDPASLGVLKGTRKIRELIRRILGFPADVYSYKKVYPYFLMPEASKEHVHPCVVPNWDNSPRSGKRAVVFHKSTPELFRNHLKQVIEQVKHKAPDKRLIFLKSWNEWAEGNHLEPDIKFGRSYLEVVREEIGISVAATVQRRCGVERGCGAESGLTS